jgi:hypothetical protein
MGVLLLFPRCASSTPWKCEKASPLLKIVPAARMWENEQRQNQQFRNTWSDPKIQTLSRHGVCVSPQKNKFFVSMRNAIPKLQHMLLDIAEYSTRGRHERRL